MNGGRLSCWHYLRIHLTILLVIFMHISKHTETACLVFSSPSFPFFPFLLPSLPFLIFLPTKEKKHEFRGQ
jgi:hypothetical protein